MTIFTLRKKSPKVLLVLKFSNALLLRKCCLQVIHPCLICECELPHNYNNLDRHFKREHDMGVIDYYNQHISKTPEAEVAEVSLGLNLSYLDSPVQNNLDKVTWIKCHK